MTQRSTLRWTLALVWSLPDQREATRIADIQLLVPLRNAVRHVELTLLAMSQADTHPAAPAANPRSPPLTLADRMKEYEASFDFTLPLAAPTILRLDGHGFSRFTANFHKPFDQRIHDAMAATCVDLLKYFTQATVAYTQSDEITLAFPSGVQSFNERVQKLSSLAASYCSVRFNAHLTSLITANSDPKIRNAGFEALGTAHFDARVFTVPTMEEALNCLLWRCRGDAMRNSVNAFARSLFSDQELHKRSVHDVLDMLRKEKGIEYEQVVPRWAVEGSLVKWEQFEYEGVNLKTGEKAVAIRARTRIEDRGIREFSEDNLRLVTEKFW